MSDYPSANSDDQRYIMVTPRLIIEDVNTAAGALVWGFPSISSFVGFSVALERSSAAQRNDVMITGVGVIHHDHTHHVYSNKGINLFILKAKPLNQLGKTEGIVQEARMRLEASFVFEICFKDVIHKSADELDEVARSLWKQIQEMRICGGRPNAAGRGLKNPILEPISTGEEGSDQETHAKQMRRLARPLMPGFALVSRAGLLISHTAKYKQDNPGSTGLDSFLDLCRWNNRRVEENGQVTWEKDVRKGWIVPISVGFAPITKVFGPGIVSGARDDQTHLCVVEPVYSLGEFVSPHRIHTLESILWRFDRGAFENHGLYISCNAHEDVLRSEDEIFEKEYAKEESEATTLMSEETLNASTEVEQT